MGITFPGESAEYRTARDALLEREVALRREMEAVAEQRRRLPPGGVVPEDYVFQGEGTDGQAADVRLSELFAPGRDTLLIYSMMFPRHSKDGRPGPEDGKTAELALEDGPCPSCTSLLDQWDGAAPHVTPLLNLVIAAKAPLPHLLTFARERGWRHLELVSCRRYLQRRLRWAGRRRSTDTDAQRIPPRRRDDPSRLGCGAHVRAGRTRTGSTPPRHARARLELARPHSRGSPDRLGRAAELLTMSREPPYA
jgi:hypothetical protein